MMTRGWWLLILGAGGAVLALAAFVALAPATDAKDVACSSCDARHKAMSNLRAVLEGKSSPSPVAQESTR